MNKSPIQSVRPSSANMADISKPDISEKEAASDIEHLETMREQHKHVDTALEILGDERVHVSEEDVRLFSASFTTTLANHLVFKEQADRPRN
jgi:hypothetical protein